jgi:hypothetical protein
MAADAQASAASFFAAFGQSRQVDLSFGFIGRCNG